MKRDATTSRAFAAQGYDPQSQTLEIQYHSGAIYQHKGVPETLYQCFVAAPSMGAYLNGGIKPAYPAERQADAVQLWVCGRVLGQTESGIVWELQGIFAREADAVKACRTELYFVGPATLDVDMPAATTEWAGCYYPLHTSQAEEESEVNFAPKD